MAAADCQNCGKHYDDWQGYCKHCDYDEDSGEDDCQLCDA
jgi:hypothetical protein